MTKTLGDGTVASHVYNLNDKVTDLNETLSGTSFARFDYGYDNLSRRTYEQPDSAAAMFTPTVTSASRRRSAVDFCG